VSDDEGMDPERRPGIGHVHLKVSDLERSLAFYTGALGFDVAQRNGPEEALLSAGGEHPHIGLQRWTSGDVAGTAGPTGLYRFGLRYTGRAALGSAVKRARDHGAAVEAAWEYGGRQAVHLRDPDGNAIELYWEAAAIDNRPRATEVNQPREGEPLDVEALIASAAAAPVSPYAPMSDRARQRLRDLRGKLLHLHKVLLEDARAAYELDRGRVGSNTNFLQLVINDPWFAWLHALSELVIRIDQSVEADSPASESDAGTLMEQTEALLTASEEGDGFARRYYEALQRQPAVVVAHADVRRILKAAR
jgi:catechol 2,3-dioxygenase